MAGLNNLMIDGVHVLLVDGDMNALCNTSKLLEFYRNKVVTVSKTSTASSLLSQTNPRFDVVLVDPNSFNPHGFEFVRDAIKTGFLVILMCAKANANQVKRAIEDGVFLVMEKPISKDDVRYVQQYVLRQKMDKDKVKSRKSSGDGSNSSSSVVRATPMMTKSQDGPNNNRVASDQGGVEYINFGPSSNNYNEVGGQTMKPKMCMEWTPELHKKFLDAIRKLGNGRCFPKDIVELMNVPGLTRMQVASHLQKCRRSGQRKRTKMWSDSSMDHPSKTKRFGLSPTVDNSNNVKRPLPSNVGAQNLNGGVALSTHETVLQVAEAEPPQGFQFSDMDIPIADDFDLRMLDFEYIAAPADVQGPMPQTCSFVGDQPQTMGNLGGPWM